MKHKKGHEAKWKCFEEIAASNAVSNEAVLALHMTSHHTSG